MFGSYVPLITCEKQMRHFILNCIMTKILIAITHLISKLLKHIKEVQRSFEALSGIKAMIETGQAWVHRFISPNFSFSLFHV